MFGRILIFAPLLTVSLAACFSPQPLAVETACPPLVQDWTANQHIVWEIDWPKSPTGGPLTVETWRVDSRYRYEILEATAPALVGETLIFDGHVAWQYNRFDNPPLSPRREVSEPALSPVSDTFAIIERLITTLPKTTNREIVQLNHHLTQKVTLTFAGGDRLVVWRDEATGLLIRVTFTMGTQQATLQARSFERLAHPPAGLFKP